MNPTAVRKFAVSCILGLLSCAASVSAQESRAFYISFKVPGSLTTSPTSINNFSTVTGSYSDAKGVHGFVREALGKITTFDIPRSTATNPAAINDDGMIVGTYTDSSNVTHGFLRHPEGTVTPIDVAGSTGIVLSGINAFGAISGYAFTSDGSECFVRSAQGTITLFGPSHCQAKGINLFGAIVGFGFPTSTPGGPPPEFLVEGFVRSPAGVITLFAAPGSSSNGTYALVIDAFGAIAGFYQNFQDNSEGFVRSPQGAFTNIVPPDSLETGVTAINQVGVITGDYNVLDGPEYAFVRDLQGTITSFNFPGGGATPTGINDFGVIIGSSGGFGILRVPY